jgi:hypothetical protein
MIQVLGSEKLLSLNKNISYRYILHISYIYVIFNVQDIHTADHLQFPNPVHSYHYRYNTLSNYFSLLSLVFCVFVQHCWRCCDCSGLGLIISLKYFFD